MSRIDVNHLNARLKLRQLVAFHAVYEAGSLVKAANRLNVTQPALTRTIRELEQVFGNPLFVRGNRGLAPTLFGEALAARVASILAEMRYTADELNALSHADAGHVVVGTIVSASAYLLPAAIAAIKATSPAIVVSVREATNDILIPALANGEIDMVIWRIPAEPLADIRHHVLYHDELAVVVSPGHPLARRRSVSLSATIDYPWIVPVAESPVRQVLNQCFHEAKLAPPANIVESLSILTNISLLGRMDAVAMLPRTAAERFAGEGTLTILPIRGLASFGDVGISTWAGRELPPAARRFYQCLLEVMG